jgi:hypothetical protein
MRKGSTDVSLDNFDMWMAEYIRFLSKVLAARRVVGEPREKRELIEAFVLRIAAVWEILVETLLIDCLNKDSSALAKYTGIPLDKHMKRPVCEAIVSGLHYFDFRNVGSLTHRSKQILARRHNPFLAIPKDAAHRIDEFFIFRNYLSHYSSAARRSVMHVYQRSYGRKRFMEPGAFLYAAQRRGGQIRLGDYVDAFLKASAEMRKACARRSDTRGGGGTGRPWKAGSS